MWDRIFLTRKHARSCLKINKDFCNKAPLPARPTWILNLTVIIMKRILLLCAVVLSGCAFVAHGQSQCAQTLRLAQSIYDQGRLQELPDLLQSCINSGFNDEEKVNAYKLLTLTYIYLEEPEKADQMMLALLRTDTEFKVNDAVDPAEFVALYKTFRTKPVYRIGGKLGGTVSGPSVISADFVNDGTNNTSNSFGFAGCVAAEIPLNGKWEKFTLNPELSFQMNSFKSVNEKGDNVLADTSLVTPSTETMGWVSIPVSLQYSLFANAAKTSDYYVSAGLSADYLLFANKTISSAREGNSGIDENTYPVERNTFNAAAMLSAGFKRKIGKGYLLVEVRYKMGLLPLSDKADTYANSTLVFNNKYIDGIYRLNTLSLSAGYLLNRYNPKKLTSR